jgi:flagellar biosynthetic protein FliR
MPSFSEAQLMAWYGSLFWPLVRVLALIGTAPLISHRAVTLRLKVALGIAITMVLAPVVPSPPVDVVLTADGFALLVQNILVGVMLGFGLRVIMAAVGLAGELIGLQAGLSFGSFFNPMSGQTENGVASFLSLVALLLFIAVDGHLLLLQALAESFRAMPLTLPPPQPVGLLQVARLGSDLFAVALSLALPFIAVMLVGNIILGVLARVAPQLNLFAVGFPITLTLGLGSLMVLLPYLEMPLRAALERGLLLAFR